MSNDRDQQIVTSSISDTGSGLLEFLSALGQREAIAFGEGVTLPVRIRLDELPKHAMPRSSSARFTEMWQQSMGDEGFLDTVVERWRLSSSGAGVDGSQNMDMFADSMGFGTDAPPAPEPIAQPHPRVAGTGQSRPAAMPSPPGGTAPRRETAPASQLRRESPAAAPASAQPAAAPAQAGAGGGGTLRSLRDRLSQRR
jgi:hypothetical protein